MFADDNQTKLTQDFDESRGFDHAQGRRSYARVVIRRLHVGQVKHVSAHR